MGCVVAFQYVPTLYQASGKSSLFTARWPRNGLFAKQFLSAGALGNPSEGAGGTAEFQGATVLRFMSRFWEEV